jgi:IMP cyclohydrolase
MYVGRIVLAGRSRGRPWVAYRVSSRSFPNRRAEVRGNGVLVSPKDPQDLAKNPYIAYNCIRVLDEAAVVANGTQADMIAERIEDGMNPLEAIGLSLLACGYERDGLATPRLAGVVRREEAWLGIARKGEFRVKMFPLAENEALMVATYERTAFEAASIAVASQDVAAIARAAYDLPFERPVCSAAAAALPGGKGFELAVYNPV